MYVLAASPFTTTHPPSLAHTVTHLRILTRPVSTTNTKLSSLLRRTPLARAIPSNSTRVSPCSGLNTNSLPEGRPSIRSRINSCIAKRELESLIKMLPLLRTSKLFSILQGSAPCTSVLLLQTNVCSPVVVSTEYSPL